jgi:hypothetical protein
LSNHTTPGWNQNLRKRKLRAIAVFTKKGKGVVMF